jgi:hypothetical protein
MNEQDMARIAQQLIALVTALDAGDVEAVQVALKSWSSDDTLAVFTMSLAWVCSLSKMVAVGIGVTPEEFWPKLALVVARGGYAED